MTTEQTYREQNTFEGTPQDETTNWLHHINEVIAIEECAQGLHPESFCSLLQP